MRKGKQKTNRREHGRTALPGRPGYDSALVAAASETVRIPRAWARTVGKRLKSRTALYVLAPDTEQTPELGGHQGEESGGGVPRARKSNQRNGCAIISERSRANWIMATSDVMRRYLIDCCDSEDGVESADK